MPRKTRKRTPEPLPRRTGPPTGPRMITAPPRETTPPVSITGRRSCLFRPRLSRTGPSTAADVERDSHRRRLGRRIGNAGLERQPLAGIERAVVDLDALGAQHAVLLVEEQDAHRRHALRLV